MVVGTVADDIRVYDFPSLKVTALRFTETARARIEKAGKECSWPEHGKLFSGKWQCSIFMLISILSSFVCGCFVRGLSS